MTRKNHGALTRKNNSLVHVFNFLVQRIMKINDQNYQHHIANNLHHQQIDAKKVSIDYFSEKMEIHGHNICRKIQ